MESSTAGISDNVYTIQIVRYCNEGVNVELDDDDIRPQFREIYCTIDLDIKVIVEVRALYQD